MAVDILIRQLLEGGVHFGHQTKRWNPKMKRFIFGERSGIYIIDLQQTAQRLKAACDFLKEITAGGGSVLFVGTKKQAQDIVACEATRCGMFFVNERWLGGTLTNFETIRKSVHRLHELESLVAPDSTADLTKKEKASIEKEIGRLKKRLAGIMQMESLPAALVVVDPKKEENAVREARRLAIPVIALLDTNCDPDNIDFPIPGNDDALKSIKLVVSMIADSVNEAKGSQPKAKEKKEVQPKKKEKEKQETVTEEEEAIIEEFEKKIEEPEEDKLRKKPRAEGKAQ
ncbi:MAG: 30S ribosomal protein S2 [Candidatus Omnitrophica bacterium]|nr:30S ribosomal protein S2 [Candidatus Omnitrophota bacterium]